VTATAIEIAQNSVFERFARAFAALGIISYGLYSFAMARYTQNVVQ